MRRVAHSEVKKLLNSLKFDDDKPFPIMVPLPDDVKLNPCPFCRCDDLCFSVSSDWNSAKIHQVRCENCGYGGNGFSNPKLATEDWNEEDIEDWA